MGRVIKQSKRIEMQKIDVESILKEMKNNPVVYTAVENQKFMNDYTASTKNVYDLLEQFSEIGNEKTLLLVAGAIGSGKTTFTHRLLELLEAKGIKLPILSVDCYYKKFSPYSEEDRKKFGLEEVRRKHEGDGELLKQYYELQHIFDKLHLYDKAMQSGRIHLVEMVPAKDDKLELINNYRKHGYKVICFYIQTKDVSINISRFAERAEYTDYSVPEDKMKNRFDICESPDRIAAIQNLSDVFVQVENSDRQIDYAISLQYTITPKDVLAAIIQNSKISKVFGELKSRASTVFKRDDRE